MQQQPSPSASKIPLSAITTDQIQKTPDAKHEVNGSDRLSNMSKQYLEDNKNLIMAILEYQKLGKFQECAQYQAVLQKNLMYLAAIADAQPPTTQTPNPSQASSSFFTPTNPVPQSSNFMQQPPQQPGGGSGQKLPFQLNSIHTRDQQQQLLHFQQQQQQFQAQMGIRAGAQNNMFGMQSALGADPGGRQGGPEVAYGGDGRGMFFDNGGFRDS
ncbi:hypothetical protein L1987_76114 [Smallanthus sonchifolius]|uniref:Uncharacterized protein n=1 Tax=Smallanthus sonchifolius TaxID=185202 RepID=A0ACB9ABQ4_9ASTR|nr:hypothetical protein L1987_76114 [Smallanthus sonchifolius]